MPPVLASVPSARPGYEGATVRVDPTSKVTVLTGASPHGQGWRPPLPRLPRIGWGSLSRMSRWCVIYVYHAPGVGHPCQPLARGGRTAIVKAGERVKAKAVQIAGALLHG